MFRQFFFVLGLLLPALAQAQIPRGNAIQPELIAEGPVAPGGEVELAILMHTKPGWHGYWSNPGEAGLPMKVDWSLPTGAAVGPLRYPVPTRLTIQGIVNYVYERDYALLARLEVPAGIAGKLAIRAHAHWLACTDKVCVPEQGDFALDLPVGAAGKADPRFDAWRQALPRPLAGVAHVARSGERLRIGIPLPASVAVANPYFFPAADGAIDYEAPQRFTRSGDTLIADLKAGEQPPSSLSGVLSYGDGQGLEIRTVPGAVPAPGSAVGGGGLIAALLGALLGGMLLNLMPCVFPILGMKAMQLARAGGDGNAAKREAMAYAAGAIAGTAGLGAILILLRAGGAAAGWAFQLQDPRTTFLLMLLAVAITLNLLKIFELPVLAGEAAPAGGLGTGALAAFVATPCSGPFMGVALGTALLLPLWGAVAVFAALGLGLALPFVAIAFVPWLRRRLPHPGPWMARLQRFLAVPMAATVAATLWLLYRQAGAQALYVALIAALLLVLVLAAVGWRQRGGALAWPIGVAGSLALAATGIALLPTHGSGVAHIPVGVQPWSEAAVASARANGKPVFVYFTADWCLTCKVNEAAAIDRAETVAAFRKADVKVLAGDWTNGDPVIGRFLESRGRAGVPLYLWYAPGAAQPEELPQLLTPAMLIGRARRAQR